MSEEQENGLLVLVGETIERFIGRDTVPSGEITDALLNIGDLAMQESAQMDHWFSVAMCLCRDISYYVETYGEVPPPSDWSPADPENAIARVLHDLANRVRESDNEDP